MLLRIWRTGVDPQRWPEYARFEREHSLPLFRQQAGSMAWFSYARRTAPARPPAHSGKTGAPSNSSRSHIPTKQLARLLDTGLLTGTQSVEVFEVATGALDALPGVHHLTEALRCTPS